MADARAELDEQGWRFFSGLHRLLLRLGGRVPDEWLTLVRGKLAGGDLVEVPSLVMGAMVVLAVPLTVGEVALLREIERTVFGDDPEGTDRVMISEETPATGHRFFPVPEGVLATDAERIPPRLDLTGRPGEDLWDLPPDLLHLDDIVMRLTDTDDQFLATVLPLREDVLSCARAWRFPPAGPLVDGVRVVLVEVAESAPAWDVTGQLQWDLAARGVSDPQVEVWWRGEALTPYQEAALAGSAVLWTAPTADAGDGRR